jgi:hypothetical protein
MGPDEHHGGQGVTAASVESPVTAPLAAGEESGGAAPASGRLPLLGGVVALVAVAAMGVVEAVRIAGSSHPQIFAGDIALIDLGARDAWRGHQLLGPYSRFGWHHPGPVLFYLMALPGRLMGNGPGINLAAVLINAAAAVAAVALVWRRAA